MCASGPAVSRPSLAVCWSTSLASPVLFSEVFMCRNIKTLHNFKPPASDEEIRAASLQFVRKLSGFARPSKVNEQAFNGAVEQVSQAAHRLLHSLVTHAPPRDRNLEAAKARARTAQRFGASERLSSEASAKK